MQKPNSTELAIGFEFLEKDITQSSRVFANSPVVAVFGGSAITKESADYQAAVRLSENLAEAGFVVITGGGSGIMKAGNEGAALKGETYGLRVKSLRYEVDGDVPNVPKNHYLTYDSLFVRMLTLISASDAIVFFPGGFGTLEETFSLLVRLRIGLMKRIPVYFYGKAFWSGLKDWMENIVLARKLIHKNDIDFMRIEDDIDAISEEIKANIL